MIFDALVLRVGVIVGVMLGIASIAIVGWSRLSRLRVRDREFLGTVLPYLGLLAGILLVNRFTRSVGQDVSWMVGLNITGVIYGIEGSFVASVQSIATPPLTTYFSFVYVYGYVFLLVFPLIAYVALEDRQFFRETCVAYTLNYAIGLLSYVLFVAYGPRNLIPDMVQPIMFATWPESRLLTSQVNVNTNVFPSLHTSLSVTVALLAYRSREIYPAWVPVASIFAGSIVVSTMYLGIHWLTDVIAGVGLALLAVSVATNRDDETGSHLRVRFSKTRVYRRFGPYLRSLGETIGRSGDGSR